MIPELPDRGDPTMNSFSAEGMFEPPGPESQIEYRFLADAAAANGVTLTDERAWALIAARREALEKRHDGGALIRIDRHMRYRRNTGEMHFNPITAAEPGGAVTPQRGEASYVIMVYGACRIS